MGVASAAAVVGLTAGGVATAADVGTDASDDVALSGTELTRASEAALEATGGGQVVDSEAEDEENGYEVEVELEDGRQVEVHLDAEFAVLDTSEDDSDDADDADDADDDD